MKKRYSILGDSISTYEGFSPMGYVFYDRYSRREAGMASVEDCWWMQVIRAMDGELGYNHSLSGSTVSGGVSISATSEIRQQALAINGIPDVILLYMGSNDWAYAVLPEEFEDAYGKMLYHLRRLYPHAQICCATLLRGADVEDPEMRFFNIDSCPSPRIYSNIIRRCVDKAGLTLIDLESYHEEYQTIDGVHPDREGMRTIADLWIRELRKL